MAYGRDRTILLATILSGQSLSAEINVNGMRIVGIQMSAGWDAAGITFAALTRTDNAHPETATFGKVQDQAGVEVVVTTPALDTYVAMAATVALEGLGRCKIRSGTAGTPVNQTANRVLGIVCVAV